MPTIKVPDYTPSGRQVKFHTSEAFETLYGGAAGGGKTAALSAEAITSALEESNTAVYIFRRTLKELKQSIYQEIMKQLAPYLNLPADRQPTRISYNGSESRFSFSNGSYIQLAYLDTVSDRYRYQSAEIHVLLLDELTHFLLDDYEYLKTRVRATDGRRTRVMAATNPGGVGHGWVKDYFITVRDKDGHVVHTEPETPYTDPNSGFKRIFIPAKVDDHPIEAFRTSYGQILSAISDVNLRKALRDGDWATFQGQVYREWAPSKHILTLDQLDETIDLQHCKKYIGFDWGWRDPAVATWIALAPENQWGVRHMYLYREIHQNETTPEDWAKQIADIVASEPVEWMALPHDCYAHHFGDKTIASVFSSNPYRLPIRPVQSLQRGAKMNRQTLLHQLLADSADGTPTLQVSERCPSFIRTVPDLPYSDTVPEEIDGKADDHDYDSATYALSLMKASGAFVVDPKPPQPRVPTGYTVDSNQRLVDYHYDFGKALRGNDQGKDWRHR
jgi:hypothetical protein